MDENQLNQKLQKEKNYLGSFALDELNEIKIDIFPSFFVINLDNRENTGTHWIAFAVYENIVYICDSLGGLCPDNSLPSTLINFLHILLISKKLFITKQLQNINSDTCGCYCVTFIKYMQRKKSFKDFLQLFTSNLKQNDNIVLFLC